MSSWRYLFYADAAYGDAMAESFIHQVSYLARTEPDAGVYCLRERSGAAHYYFSPQAAQVAARFGARAC